MSSTNSTQFCYFHTESDCMTCSIMAATCPHATESDGTTDLATSIYPEIDVNILARPELPHKASPKPPYKALSELPYSVCPEVSFRAPVAKMCSPTHQPVLKLDTAIRSISKFWYPPFEVTAEHDDYGERLALSPVDRPKMLAGMHYSDKLALSPIEETSHEYPDELALSPFYSEGRQLKCGGRKQFKSDKIEDVESTILVAAEEKPHRASESRKVSFQVEDKKPKESPKEEPARGRKRKHRVEEEEPVRKSKRSRKTISYAE